MARSIARPGQTCWRNVARSTAARRARLSSTRGYRLKARHVIHTVGPIYSGRVEDAALLSSSVKNSLRLAEEYHLTSIAFPAISTGVYGYPMDEAAHVILSTLIDRCRGETGLTRIVMCLYDARARRVFDETLTQLSK